MERSRLTSRVWYLVAVGFLISAIGVAVIGYTQMRSTIDGMRRVVMPGKDEIVLPAGLTTLYAEQRSRIDGTVYEADPAGTFRCSVSVGGREMPLVVPTSSVSYELAGYAGHNAFDVQIDEPGTYTVACDADQRFVMAIGRGVGAWLMMMVIAIVPAMAALAITLVVRLRRGRQLRRIAAQAARK